jgi:hypothetical protein
MIGDGEVQVFQCLKDGNCASSCRKRGCISEEEARDFGDELSEDASYLVSPRKKGSLSS